jgi:hypothetical protein
MTVVLMYDPMLEHGDRTGAFGYPLVGRNQLTIIIRVNLSLFTYRTMRAKTGTVNSCLFHELTHIMRSLREPKRVTVADIIISEGLATFFQMRWADPPFFMYRDISQREITAAAKHLRPILHQRFHLTADRVHARSTIDESLYRFGYAMFEEYIRQRRQPVTYAQLLKIRDRDYHNFLRQWIDTLCATPTIKSKNKRMK